MAPPNSADTAPLHPVQIPAITAITAVAMSCHRSTVRIGLVLSGGINRAREADEPSSGSGNRKPADYSRGDRAVAIRRLALHQRNAGFAVAFSPRTMHRRSSARLR